MQDDDEVDERRGRETTVEARRPVVAVSADHLADIATRGIPIPTYDRSELRGRIVHIGVGGFHRAHLALYTHQLAERGERWGILGLGLLANDAAMAAALAAQDHLYTLVERGSGAPTPQVIGSIVGFTHAADEHERAVELLADPSVAIVSMTITEAGYTPGAGPAFPILATALDRRRLGGGEPLTILSCDNLPGNGDTAKAATLTAARSLDAELARWIDERCTFPNSMVDRITPVTTDDDRRWLVDTYGVEDRWPVVAEPFHQWVIQDRFAAGRPPWEDVGVLFTDDVHAWELYKLRMLNAAHSTMAYLCALEGIRFVDEAMDRTEVRHFLDRFLTREAIPSLTPIPGHPRADYAATVLQRFTNTGVRDQIARLCIDGAAKFPTFLIPTVEHNLAADGPVHRAALALAGWARYLGTVPIDEQAADASGDEARRHSIAALDEPTRFLEFTPVVTPALRDSERFRTAFEAAYRNLADRGPIEAMAAVPIE